jgi:hypothetical protein
MNWIKVSDRLPNEGQAVWYYFDICGVYHGEYQRTPIDDFMPDAYMDCFFSESGFLCDDVTHWMPYSDGDKTPEPPQ